MAAQTGVGSPTTRGLIGAIRRAEATSIEEYGSDDLLGRGGPGAGTGGAAVDAHLGRVLAAEGWRWPVPPLHAVMQSAAGVAKSGRRSRSAMASHDTGVPAATWSALGLLTSRVRSGLRAGIPHTRGVGADRLARRRRHPVEPQADAGSSPLRSTVGRLGPAAKARSPVMTVTLTPVTVTNSVGEDNFAVGLDPEADVGFFTMAPASAEQVTVQIQTVLDRAWEFIALAVQRPGVPGVGIHQHEYVDARFGDLRLVVPREHRTQIVATLAGARMSVRAIAKLLTRQTEHRPAETSQGMLCLSSRTHVNVTK